MKEQLEYTTILPMTQEGELDIIRVIEVVSEKKDRGLQLD
jgi:hypothetical protein